MEKFITFSMKKNTTLSKLVVTVCDNVILVSLLQSPKKPRRPSYKSPIVQAQKVIIFDLTLN